VRGWLMLIVDVSKGGLGGEYYTDDVSTCQIRGNG